MCGIVGVVSFDKAKDIAERRSYFQQALYANTLRGHHSTGMFCVPLDKNHKDINELALYKKAMAGYDFIQLDQFNRLLLNMEHYKFVVGHNRAKTIGDVTDRNSHPFSIGHITLVHNGTLTELHSLEVPNHWHIPVDSEVLTMAIVRHGYQNALAKLRGAAALVWYDEQDDVLRLFRNKERPLFYALVKGENTAFIASEIEMILWLAWRNGYEIGKYYFIEENSVLTVKDNVKKFTTEKIKPEVPKPIISYPPRSTALTATPKHETVGITLAKAGLTLGEIIRFSLEGMEFNHKKSRHGVLRGRLWRAPWSEIIAHGIERGKFSGNFLLQGKVEGITHDARSGINVIRVGEVSETDEEDLANSIATQREDDSPPEWDDELKDHVPGPGGYLIRLDQFKEFTKHGCAHCSAALPPEKAREIKWTRENQPVCWACQDLPGVREYCFKELVH